MGRDMNVESLRNLVQYKDKTDEELRAILEHKTLAKRVEERIALLGEEYDLSDMRYHDRLLLERLFTAIIRLEDAEEELEGKYARLSPNDRARAEGALSILRSDILKIQNDLAISRLRRAQETEDNPIVLFADIKQRAKRFLEDRLCWALCDNCGMQLAKVHFTYPQEDSELNLTCGRCGSKTKFTSKELLETEGANPYK